MEQPPPGALPPPPLPPPLAPAPLAYAHPYGDPSFTPIAQPRQQSMLAWWALIPLLPFLAIQFVYGWPDAKVHATSPEFAGAYLTGGTVGPLLVSLLIAWIVYRVASRSRLGGSLTFCLLMLLVCGAALNAHFRPLLGRGRIVTGPRTFSPAGLTVTGPTGWRAIPPDRPDLVTAWISPDSTAGDLRAMIMIDRKGPPQYVDARASALRLARLWGGQVIEPKESLDGETAWRVRAPSAKPGLQPVEALVAIHGGYLYLLQGGVSPGHSCGAEVDFVQAHWKWLSPPAPAKP